MSVFWNKRPEEDAGSLPFGSSLSRPQIQLPVPPTQRPLGAPSGTPISQPIPLPVPKPALSILSTPDLTVIESTTSVSPPTRPGAPLPLYAALANSRTAGAAGVGAPAPPLASTPALPLGPERHMSFFRLDDFVLVRSLGTGTFGRVYLARYKTVAKYFALKKLRKIDIYRLKQVDHVHNERSLLSRLSHPFIIKLFSAMQDERHLYMLLEFAPGGELFHFLRRAGRLSLDAARFYIAELVLAIEYLHQHDVVYRDLKPENLLLDKDGHLKLADFGFAKVVPNLTYTLCGTPEYLAPEIILGRGYGRSVDWWALGILLFEMLTGNPPFNGETPTAIYEKTLKGKVYYPSFLTQPTIEFVSGLLLLDPSRRLGCSERGALEVKQMEFFADINWEAVYHRAYRPPIIPSVGNPDLALNFPPDDCKSSMDFDIPNEDLILRSQGVHFPGFAPAA